MKGIIFLIIFIILITNVSALCEEGQIDINTASAEELEGIIQIGPARAQEIIELREEKLFESVDDLVRVSGIAAGGSNLAKIKEEGLACVDLEEENQTENTTSYPEDEETKSETSSSDKQSSSEKEVTYEPLAEETPSSIKLETINLNPKVIKTENNNEGIIKSYAFYGFVAFSVFLGVLFIIRENRYKNEFR